MNTAERAFFRTNRRQRGEKASTVVCVRVEEEEEEEEGRGGRVDPSRKNQGSQVGNE